MATTTDNLGMTLPAGTDRALVSDLNQNFQTLDAFAGQATADIQEAQETANAAAPQSTTYTKAEVDTALAAKLNTADVDDALSETSINPAQNRAIRAPIARLVDAGAKNMFDFETWLSSLTGASRGTITTQSQSFTLTATENNAYTIPQVNGFHIPVKPNTDYVIAMESADSNGQLVLLENDAFFNFYVLNTGEGTLHFKTSSSADRLSVRFGVLTSGNTSTVSNIMLCTTEDYSVSQEFAPYAPSNRELYEGKVDHSIQVLTGSILDYAVSLPVGLYFARHGAEVGTDKPETGKRYMYQIMKYASAAMTLIAYEGQGTNSNSVYIKNYTSNIWGAWIKFTGTAVT